MHLTIKSKLIGGYIITLSLLIAMGIFMTRKLSESNLRLLKVVEVTSKKINLSNELMINVLDIDRNEKNIMYEKDPIQKDFYKDRIFRSLEIIDKKTIELDELVDEKGKIMLNEFKSNWANYRAALNNTLTLAMKNEGAEAFNISVNRGRNTRNASIGYLQQLIDKNEKSMQSDKIENTGNYNATLSMMLALIILGVLLTIIIFYWITQVITKRIIEITKVAEKIASREFANDKLEDDTNDELKSIFDALVSVNESFREVSEHANAVASGNYAIDLSPRSDDDTLGNALSKMTHSLRETTAANVKLNWLTDGQNQLNEKLKGDQSIEELANNTIGFLCTYLNANIGAVYQFNDHGKELVLTGQYAFPSHRDTSVNFALNEGLIGQAAQEQKQISLTDLTREHIRITSSVLNVQPKHLLITPFLFEGKTVGVIEMGKLSTFSETENEFIKVSMGRIAISVNSAIARKKILELLEETQVQSIEKEKRAVELNVANKELLNQAEELQVQQEELKQMNEELEEQAQNLKQQQEELQMTNEELEEQTQSLEIKNMEVETAKNDIEQKTKQLEISSRYKSEFLANMSHELRTPLNSLLILSKDLSENRNKNLDSIQVESAEIIYKSGADLLVLINEVLDLSKIEAGKMSVHAENISLKNLANELIREFKHHAEQKGLSLNLKLDKELPESIRTDPQRLNQILKNLLSNAMKFTEKGSVSIGIKRHSDRMVIISVTDTGIGIQEDKQMAIFEAFQQAEGGTSRKYGGTGLGLSISRELAKLLGAEIKLTSKLYEGSTFDLIIPLEINQEQENLNINTWKEPVSFKPHTSNDTKYRNYPHIPDDRGTLTIDDNTVLIIEDDLVFAAILFKNANNKGFKCLSAATGEDGLHLAAKYKPQAIILDMSLPGINGHVVLRALKADPFLRHIPVHIISAKERSLEPIKEGAVEYLMKPVAKKDLDEAFNRIENFVSRKIKNLLIIEDSENSRRAMRILIGNGDVQCFEAGTGKEALSLYQQNHIDCIILDIGLPDMSGFELIGKLENMKDNNIPPIIVYTGKELTREENYELQKYAESIIIKGVKSEERLLDETSLFLHRTISKLPKSKQMIIANLYNKEAVFHGKKILLVDDDMRNLFALSKILKERGIEVIKAENGQNALEMLNLHAGINLVLMDIMMPEMDGYEAMKAIRSQLKFKSLPVIALTAKAMKDDKQKCIDAGANDYIAKPIDVERLLSLMRVWLSQ